MKTEIDLYIDMPNGYIVDPNHIMAIANPTKLMAGSDRYRITVRLDSKYFKDPVKGDLVVEETKLISGTDDD